MCISNYQYLNIGGDSVENRYNKEYEQYYIYALEQFLIKTYGFSEHDAKLKVMQDFDEVKEDFEMKEMKWTKKLSLLLKLISLSWRDIKSVPSKYKMEKVEGGLEEIDWWINNK